MLTLKTYENIQFKSCFSEFPFVFTKIEHNMKLCVKLQENANNMFNNVGLHYSSSILVGGF